MTDRLEPCPTPWCEPEHEKYTWQGSDDLFCVICDGCQVEGPHCENEGDAHDAWNTRTTSLAAQDGLDIGQWVSARLKHSAELALSEAAQDGLVEALELVQKLIADAFEQIAPLKRQGEDRIWQPASTACVMLWDALNKAKAALASIEVKS